MKLSDELQSEVLGLVVDSSFDFPQADKTSTAETIYESFGMSDSPHFLSNTLLDVIRTTRARLI